MNEQKCDITTYIWFEHESVGFPTSHTHSLALFQKNVVQPSLRALDAEINKLEQSDDPSACFLVDDFAELFQSSVEGFLIAVQSMWERGLRNMLLLREQKLYQGAQSSAIKRATWGGKSKDLQRHFLRLIGVPLEAFDSYSDLDLLQNLGSAIRHGDGQAAQAVHRTSPSLWINWLPPSSVIDVGDFCITTPGDESTHPSFDAITLTEALLEQMIQAVHWFWEDIELMRCNSFKRKHHSVVEKLSNWQTERSARACKRHWNPK